MIFLQYNEYIKSMNHFISDNHELKKYIKKAEKIWHIYSVP